MSYRVFRVHRGRVQHIIHETLTGNNHTNNVYVLCEGEPYSGVYYQGNPTCPKCLQIDNPCKLSVAERYIIARIATRDPYPPSWGYQAITSLHQKDLIDKNEKLTRRGAILALDWATGPVPAVDALGIMHARGPLSTTARCGHGGVLSGFDKMTVDRYARLRALDQHVTCVLCASAYWQ